jgi:hypothetical protein
MLPAENQLVYHSNKNNSTLPMKNQYVASENSVSSKCSGYWEGGLRCALIRCMLGSGKSEKGWDFGGEGAREQWGTKGSSLRATWDRGGLFLSHLEGAK